MIRSIHIKSELTVDDLIASGYTVKIDYDMDFRNSPHSCLGCIMKDGRSVPFFDMDDNHRCITEIGLVGHEWGMLLGEIFNEFHFSYGCGSEEKRELQKALDEYKDKCRKQTFSPEVVKALVDSGTIWLVIGSLISADTIHDYQSARKSLANLNDIKRAAAMLDIGMEVKQTLLAKLADCITLAENEMQKYNNND